MSHLLTIPREIRDKILNLIISSSIAAPQHISDPSNRAALDHRSYAKGEVMLYLKYPTQTDATTLLLVNRQIHTETLSALHLLPSKHSYILDVLVVNQQCLWPTWLYVPIITRRVEKVYCQFRTIGFLPARARGLFTGSDGGPPNITWTLLSLLVRFLRSGPVGSKARKGDQRFSVKEIVIDVQTPLDITPEAVTAEELARGIKGRTIRHMMPVVRTAREVARYIASDLKLIMKMDGDHGWLGRIVFERVGKIKVLLDGDQGWDEASNRVVEWDVKDVLRDASWSRGWGDYTRRHAEEGEARRLWGEWIENVYRERREFGLDVEERVKGVGESFLAGGERESSAELTFY